MIDFVGKRGWYFIFSLLVLVPGLISLAILPGLRPGIDFSSGTALTLRFEQPVQTGELRSAIGDLGHHEAIIQESAENTFLVRTAPLREEVRDESGAVTQPGEREELVQALQGRFGTVEVLDASTVSPAIAADIIRNSALSVLVAMAGILIYIWWAFRHLAKPLLYAVAAIIALAHDVLITLGIYSILGHIFGLEVDALFITALLTVIGFSVHDSIVVFDRIRENARRHSGLPFPEIVNHSLLQTVARSLNTSLTAVLMLLALLLFGGVTIRSFVLVLLIGIISGTYSSIFTASQLLVAWEEGDFRRWFGRGRGRVQ
ncbi:MAG TPA: protein translocase subunit SecF, partial [Dehalococcoidia bacterium]|nr:protein translocase subunit SecF [Dehalococcoidia bacterium]